ncbi:hypothetical protein E2C01_001628 [Portunus trituberculatus]|uniref:Uncharacterized protein n=1 Tax=Portunus trituberculatus TaxID=210409 RepID=A0A5B7CKW5_PORTR|nr:hypothetical protein [Portunus trituberculatus]
MPAYTTQRRGRQWRDLQRVANALSKNLALIFCCLKGIVTSRLQPVGDGEDQPLWAIRWAGISFPAFMF